MALLHVEVQSVLHLYTTLKQEAQRRLKTTDRRAKLGLVVIEGVLGKV